MLAFNAVVGRAGKEHKAGAELWRLLVYNFDKKTCLQRCECCEDDQQR